MRESGVEEVGAASLGLIFMSVLSLCFVVKEFNVEKVFMRKKVPFGVGGWRIIGIADKSLRKQTQESNERRYHSGASIIAFCASINASSSRSANCESIITGLLERCSISALDDR